MTDFELVVKLGEAAELLDGESFYEPAAAVRESAKRIASLIPNFDALMASRNEEIRRKSEEEREAWDKSFGALTRLGWPRPFFGPPKDGRIAPAEPDQP